MTCASAHVAEGLNMSCQLPKERVEEKPCAAPFGVHCNFLQFIFHPHMKLLEALSCLMNETDFYHVFMTSCLKRCNAV